MASVFLPYSKVLFFTSSGSFLVPSDWNPYSNLIAALGAGANGAAGPKGGGGGAFAWSVNISTLVFETTYTITVGVPASPTSSFSSLVAAAGGNGVNGGLASSCTGQNKFSGGNGSSGIFGQGGGGAAGPNGAGSSGTNLNQPNGQGGAADGGTVSPPFSFPADGLSGTEFDLTHGCGTGGNASGTAVGKGGLYGGGGSVNASVIGTGAQGLVIVAYNPLSPAALFLGM